MLVAGAVLMSLAGLTFALSSSFLVLLAAAIVGVISPSGNEIGPFLPIEQAAISEEVTDSRRTRLFAWYNLIGSIATALGALVAGWSVQWSENRGIAPLAADRGVLFAYAAIGVLLAVAFSQLSERVEAAKRDAARAEDLSWAAPVAVDCV